ncbi:MAG TPA: hypothetical protein VNU68_35650 [Verrucomicrobiae bacterium]|nr:hypothetical protein [Verrucomicrobiae bacterium]
MSLPTDSTADPAIAQTIKQCGSWLVHLSKMSERRLEGYRRTHDVSGESEDKVYVTTEQNRQRSRIKPKQKAPADHIKPELLHAAQLAKDMIKYAREAELIDLANAGFALIDSLDELWKHRAAREIDWGGAVNLLRAALTKIAFERLTVEQCDRILQFIQQCLASGNVDSSDQQLGLRLLRRANLDPWRVISNPSNEV